MAKTDGSIVALDVGERRVGIAVASRAARIATPLITIERSHDFWQQLDKLINQQEADEVVLGYPRSMEGKTTTQTAVIEQFGIELQNKLNITPVFQDETLTSVKAKEELARRGQPYEKGDIDALAATYILEDYLRSFT